MYTPVVKGNPRAYKNWCNSKWTHVRAVTGAWQWEERFLLASLMKVRAFCLMCLVPGSLPCPPSASLGGFGTVRRRLPSASCCSTRSTAENSGGKKIKLNNYMSIRLGAASSPQVGVSWVAGSSCWELSSHRVSSISPQPAHAAALTADEVFDAASFTRGISGDLLFHSAPVGRQQQKHELCFSDKFAQHIQKLQRWQKNTHDVQLLPSSISLGKKWTKSLQKSYHIQSRIWV